MSRRVLIPVLIWLHTLSVWNIYGQANDTMLKQIISKLNSYTSHIPREEVFIHSDKDEYIAGEDFWFNVFLFDRQRLMLSANSNIVYLEVLNAMNMPVARNRIFIKNGTGPGHFVLPDTLSTGIYTIRAYTNWMKNFLPYNCFIKEITVYNTLKTESSVALKNRSSVTVPDKKNLSGLSLTINHARKDSLEVRIQKSNDFRRKEETLYLVIQTRGNVDFTGSLTLADSTVRVYVPKIRLTGGINQVIVFNEEGMPVADRYIYTPGRRVDTLRIICKDEYALREKINLEFDPQNKNLKEAGLSISVSPVSEYSESAGLSDYLVFGSEFNSGSGFFDWRTFDVSTEEEKDSILSSLSSNWIRWPAILAGDYPDLRYHPENEYHFIYGFIPGGVGDMVIMCSPSGMSEFQYTTADENGNFSFKLHMDEITKDLIFMPHTRLPGERIILNSSFSDKYFSYTSSERVKISPVRFSRSGVDYQVRRLFNVQVTGEPYDPLFSPRKPARVLGRPDHEIVLSDYIELPAMSEIFHELIPGVSLRETKSGYEITMAIRINDRRIDLDPTLMIDGVIINDASLIAELDPALVERIDVTTQKYLIGGFLFDGIVNVITKGNFSNIQMPDRMMRVSYRISDPVPRFVSPDYSSGNIKTSRLPDYRNTLYWNPSVSVLQPVGLWSSDNKMKYLVKIQGVTGDGRIIDSRKIFVVK